MDTSVVLQEVNLRYSGAATHVSWCRVSNLLAISFKALRESEVKICVLEPSQPNLTVTLRVPLKDSRDSLVTLQWSPVGCKRVLLAVTRSGTAVAWMQTKPDTESTQTVRTIDEWHGHQVFQLSSEVVGAVWLNEPATMQWTPPSPDMDLRKHTIETLFMPEDSKEEEEDFKVFNSYWVRPGLLCIAVLLSNRTMQYWWLPMGTFANQLSWSKSPPVSLAPFMGKGGCTCMAAITTYGVGVRIAMGLEGDNSGRVKVLRVAGDPTCLDTSGVPLHNLVVDELANVILSTPQHVAHWVRWMEGNVGTCLAVCSCDPAVGSAQMSYFTFPPSGFRNLAPGSAPALLSWSPARSLSVTDLLPSPFSQPPHPLTAPSDAPAPPPRVLPNDVALSHDGQQLAMGAGTDVQLLLVSELDGLHAGERLWADARTSGSGGGGSGGGGSGGSGSGSGADAGKGGGGGSSSQPLPPHSLVEFSPNACCLCSVHSEYPETEAGQGGSGRQQAQQPVLRLWCLREPQPPSGPAPAAVPCTAVRCAWAWALAHHCWDVGRRISAMGDLTKNYEAVTETFGLLDLLIAGLAEHVKPRAAHYLDRLKLQVASAIQHPEAVRISIELKARSMLLMLERIFGVLAYHRVEAPAQSQHSQDKQNKRYMPNDLMAALPWIQWGLDFFWLYLQIIHRWLAKLRKGVKEEYESLPLVRFMGDVYLHRRLTIMLQHVLTAATQLRKQHIRPPGNFTELQPLLKALTPMQSLWLQLDKWTHLQHKKLMESVKDVSDGEAIAMMQDKAAEVSELFPSELRFQLHPYRCYGPVSSTMILEVCARWSDSTPLLSDAEIHRQLRHLGLALDDKFPTSSRRALLAAHQRFRRDAPLPPPPGICSLGMDPAASDLALQWSEGIRVALGQAPLAAGRWRRDVISMRSLGLADSSRYELLDASGTTLEYEPQANSGASPSFMSNWRRAWLAAGPFTGSAWKHSREAAASAATNRLDSQAAKRARLT